MASRARRATARDDEDSAGRLLAVEQIVEAALRVGVAKGFESLTMRALAEELGVSTMAAYYHVPNKRALIELVIDTVLAEIEVPPEDYGTWDERLYELQMRSAQALARYPGLDSLVYSRPPTAQGWRLLDAYFAILRSAGFSRRNAIIAFSIIHAHGLGRSVLERRFTGADEGAGTAGWREWPTLREMGDLWPQLHRPDYRAFALESILDGLRVMLAEQQAELLPPRRGGAVEPDAGEPA